MRQIGFAALLGLASMATGCKVDQHNIGDGKDVKIATPFGGIHVATDDTAVLDKIGLPAYPGAVPVKKDNGGGDHESADVNLSFGSFQLQVKTANYRTDDPAAKVETFYRAGLRRFGDVIACRSHQPVGAPTRTAEGLGCEDSDNKHAQILDHGDQGDLELKAGSRQHQHLVQIKPDGGGTRIELIALDLPSQMFSGHDSSAAGDGRQ